MLETIIFALKSTPTWVYVLFLYLIFVGIKSSKGGYVSLTKLSILPIIFTYMSLHSLMTAVPTTAFNIILWCISISLGILGGAWRIKHAGIRYDTERKQVYLHGSWITLIVIMIIFISKYAFGYAIAVNPGLFKDSWFDILYISISGLCTGQFIGVLACALFTKRRALVQAD